MKGCVALLSVLLLSSNAMAETNELTLSCDGTSKVGNRETRITNTWLVVDMADMTISGFGIVGVISEVKEAIISFEGRKEFDGKKTDYSSMAGTLDQKTGNAIIMVYSSGYNEEERNLPSWTAHLSLVCTPIKRLF